MSIIKKASSTTLRDIPYDNTGLGVGNGEPYVTTPIPPLNSQSIPNTDILLSDRGFIRGGIGGSVISSIKDVRRISKFMTDPPKGPLFITKQVGLQLSNPRLEPSSNIVSRILNTAGSTRIYNMGLNTITQIPLTAFGQHIPRHGVLPTLNDSSKYENIVRSNDREGTLGTNNRLVKLYNKLGKDQGELIIDSYIGGSDSVYGVGRTLIRRYDRTLNNPKYNQYFETNVEGKLKSFTNLRSTITLPLLDIDYYQTLGLSEEYFTDNENENINQINKPQPDANGEVLVQTKPPHIDQTYINYGDGARTYNKIKETIESQQVNKLGVSNISQTSSKPNSVTFNINNITSGSSFMLSKQDEINLTPLFTSTTPPETIVTIGKKDYNIEDIIKFRIESIDGDNPNNSTWIIFRAYIDSLQDSYNPEWNTEKYIGRGENFYSYGGFSRSVSLSFQIAALSKEEMSIIYQKLNYLVSNTMPDYKDGIMRSPMNRITVGDYLNRELCVINSLTVDINENSPWSTIIGGEKYELPHILEVKISLDIIHNNLPRKLPLKQDNIPLNKYPWIDGIYVDKRIPKITTI